MRRRLGYIPTLKELHFELSGDAAGYRGRHRPSVRLTWRQALAALSRHLGILRAAMRTLVPTRPPRLIAEPWPVPAIDTATLEMTTIVNYQRHSHRAPSALRVAVRHLSSLRSGARDAAPGRHRLEDLSQLDNPRYLSCMQARINYVLAHLGQLKLLADGPRAHGEPSLLGRIRANLRHFERATA